MVGAPNYFVIVDSYKVLIDSRVKCTVGSLN